MTVLDLRARRINSGLTAAALGRAAGTAESNITAYERGTKTPVATTVERIAKALAAGADSPIFVNRLVTVPAAAAALRRGLRAGWATADLLRVVRESRSNARWLADADDVSAFFAPPTTTGDTRWDALVAGSSEDLALRHGHPVPAWSAGHALTSLWFVSDNVDFDAYALAHSPVPLKVRGVLVDPADLESV
ncbi:MAG: helix-turn-helix domain-containing protein [Actinomycetota bacterium]|nr:helix-turn-helix domain-containing protein [Actinomycetota bacterium]